MLGIGFREYDAGRRAREAPEEDEKVWGYGMFSSSFGRIGRASNCGLGMELMNYIVESG